MRRILTVVSLSLVMSGCVVHVSARRRAPTTAITTTGGYDPAGQRVAYAPPSAPAVTYSPGPPPHSTAVWVDGHWEFDGYQYVWVDGYWIDGRDDCDFVQPSWEQRGPEYVYVPGGYRDRRSGVIVSAAPPPPRGGTGGRVTGRAGGTVLVEPAPPPGRGGTGTVVVTPPTSSPPRGSGTVVVTPPSSSPPRGTGSVVVTPPPSSPPPTPRFGQRRGDATRVEPSAHSRSGHGRGDPARVESAHRRGCGRESALLRASASRAGTRRGGGFASRDRYRRTGIRHHRGRTFDVAAHRWGHCDNPAAQIWLGRRGDTAIGRNDDASWRPT